MTNSLLYCSAILNSIIFCIASKLETYDNATQKTFVYNTYSYEKIIDVSVNNTTTQILDFYEATDMWSGYPTRVHVSTNDSIRGENPLFVTATQQKSVSSWELPLTVTTNHGVLRFDDMAGTLCPHDAGPNITSQSPPTLTLSTSSPRDVNVKIKLHRVKDFYLEMNKEVPLSLTPSSPKYFYFSFDRDPWNVTRRHKGLFPKFNYTIPKTVLLTIDSEDDVCAVISIQNNSCPIFDNEKDVMYQGYHFTMTTRGGITVTQSMFPKGFYVVFIVKENDEECTGKSEIDDVSQFRLKGRSKSFKLSVVQAASTVEYLMGALAFLALILLVTALAPLGNLLTCRHEEIIVIDETVVPSTSRDNTESEPMVRLSDDSDPESDVDVEVKSLPIPLNLAGLSRHGASHNRRSNRYFWSALTVAVVYALPVVQLLLTYQRMVFQTGDQDVCYYNFLCAHPLGPLADFNHVYTNLGYVILGIVFMVQARCRHMKQIENQELGIPQHLGLFYSMGLALAMEGLLSACYHLCPNKMNFQFDSSFMYVIAVLCIVKLYQSRHPDVNASAHATFMLLALLMAIGLFGIMYPSVYFWVIFTIMHLGVCFVFTFKIYYVGRFKMERAILPGAWRSVRQHGFSAFKPNYTARAVLLAIANIANIALASYGLYEHNKDFAKHLLAILMGNTILYNFGYVVMKLVHKEHIPAAAWLWLCLAHVVWGLAAYLFLSSRTKWSETPAQSRQHNAFCDAMGVFDTHDLWHLASATALFFSFNALLILDEPLDKTPRHLIPVF